jgi:hypothetical protein
MKEIWSNKYGKNPAEGLHKHLEKVIKNYKRQDLQKYLKGFAIYLNKPNKYDTVKLASNNFSKWCLYVKLKTLT